MGGNCGDNDDEREAVARYMLYYYKKSKVDQQQILMDWIKYTSHDKNRRIYYLPTIADRLKTTINPIDEEYSTKLSSLGNYTVCRSAIGFILNISKYAWMTCAKAVGTNTIPQHGNLKANKELANPGWEAARDAARACRLAASAAEKADKAAARAAAKAAAKAAKAAATAAAKLEKAAARAAAKAAKAAATAAAKSEKAAAKRRANEASTTSGTSSFSNKKKRQDS